jgi:hypothetical protein
MSTADLVRFSKAEIPRAASLRAARGGVDGGIAGCGGDTRGLGFYCRNLGRMLGKLYDWTGLLLRRISSRGGVAVGVSVCRYALSKSQTRRRGR